MLLETRESGPVFSPTPHCCQGIYLEPYVIQTQIVPDGRTAGMCRHQYRPFVPQRSTLPDETDDIVLPGGVRGGTWARDKYSRRGFFEKAGCAGSRLERRDAGTFGRRVRCSPFGRPRKEYISFSTISVTSPIARLKSGVGSTIAWDGTIAVAMQPVADDILNCSPDFGVVRRDVVHPAHGLENFAHINLSGLKATVLSGQGRPCGDKFGRRTVSMIVLNSL